MAITKILTINDSGVKFAGKHLKQAIEYIIDREKTQGGRFVTGINCQPENAFCQMKATKIKYGKTDKRQGYHLIISFEEGEVTPDIAFEIIGKFVEEYLGQSYEAVYSVHDNTAHVHGHIIFNSVNYATGRKYRYEKGDWAKIIQPITNRLCEEYGLSTIDIEEYGKQRNERYKDWNEFRDGKLIWRDMIKRDLDACVMQSNSFEEFIDLLVEKGYDIKQNQYLAVKPQGMQRFCRCKSLGEDYTEESIRRRIAEDLLTSYANRNRKGNSYEVEAPKDEFLRRTKLSGIQKTYYARVCRIRRLEKLPYSKAWQYREEIRKLQEYHERYLFLVKNDIHSLVELVAVSNNLEAKVKECQTERRQLYRDKRRFEPLFAIVDKMDRFFPAEQSYQGGDTFFEKEHLQYEMLRKELDRQGYTKTELKAIRKQFEGKISGNYEKRKAAGRNLRLSKCMIDEIRSGLELAESRQQEMDRTNREEQPKR
ncbi:MAG: relaxase/mobilization nuclease domain-containing protein [Lachnospiraceae bacterium]|nr:relaxase/mobilization nuclease domain-containing protein [Lachnospiraceae bacterium]